MTNRYYDNLQDIVNGTLATAPSVEAGFDAVEAGFDAVQAEMDVRAAIGEYPPILDKSRQFLTNDGTSVVWNDLGMEVLGYLAVEAASGVTLTNLAYFELSAGVYMIVAQTSQHAIVYNSNTNTWGSWTACALTAVSNAKSARLDASTVAIVGSASATLKARILSVTGTTIVVGSEYTQAATAGHVFFGVASLNSTTFVVATQLTSSAPATAVHAATFAGTVISWGAGTVVVSGVTTLGTIHLERLTNSEGFVVSAYDTTLMARAFLVAGAVVTIGSGATTAITTVSAVYVEKFNSGRWLLSFTNTTRKGCLLSITGAAATISAEHATVLIASSVNYPIDANRLLLSTGSTLQLVRDNGGTLEVGASVANPAATTHALLLIGSAGALLSTGTGATAIWAAQFSVTTVTFSNPNQAVLAYGAASNANISPYVMRPSSVFGKVTGAEVEARFATADNGATFSLSMNRPASKSKFAPDSNNANPTGSAFLGIQNFSGGTRYFGKSTTNNTGIMFMGHN